MTKRIDNSADAMRTSGVGQQEPAHAHRAPVHDHAPWQFVVDDQANSSRLDAMSEDDLALATNRGMSPVPDEPATPPSSDPPLPPIGAFDGRRWLTLADIADELMVSTRTVMRWAERGQLPVVVLPGGRKRVRADQFAKWLDQLSTQPYTGPEG